MLPVIAIVGRPNVGKSTLFNCLTRTRDALVADIPGVTRDRQYGYGRCGDYPFIIVDTGGLGEDDKQYINQLMAKQTEIAIHEADSIIFLVDAQSGVTAADQAIAHQLRKIHKPVHLVVNKMDGFDEAVASGDFFSLGMGNPTSIAAAHGRGIVPLINQLLEKIKPTDVPPTEEHQGIKLAIVGRPNVGKSTLVNRMLGEERVIVLDQPGTTRDAIAIAMERHGKHYTLIDTAGVRRKGQVTNLIEKFSAIKTLQAISEAHVVLMIIDSQREISQQDLHLLNYIIDAGKALVLAINKWDYLPQENKVFIRKEIERKLHFVDFAQLHFISALHGTGVGDLFTAADIAYDCAMRSFSTHELTSLLHLATQTHSPPMVNGRTIKLRYAHVGGKNPPIIVVHGNQVDSLPSSYVRYLEHFYRKRLRLTGTPIRIQLKSGDNPYKDVKNTLTRSQTRKRQRLMSFVKKK